MEGGNRGPAGAGIVVEAGLAAPFCVWNETASCASQGLLSVTWKLATLSALTDPAGKLTLTEGAEPEATINALAMRVAPTVTPPVALVRSTLK